jgi:L-ascorbate metabolism protein UlaG (beta-lactamase superfamily)
VHGENCISHARLTQVALARPPGQSGFCQLNFRFHMILSVSYARLGGNRLLERWFAMRHLAALYFSLTAIVTCTVAQQNPSNIEKSGQATLEYMGAAGWRIADGTTVILIDPYLSRILGPPPPLAPPYARPPGDTRPVYGWDDVAVPDVAAIDSRVPRADFILVTHTHYDHVLDVPHIALKTHSLVIGTESTENVMRAYSMPEQQLITVRGGEDYDFGAFSVKVIPSLHSPLDHKHYFSSETAPAGMKAPLTLRQMHPEGATLAYLIRFHGHQILAFGGMNYMSAKWRD